MNKKWLISIVGIVMILLFVSMVSAERQISLFVDGDEINPDVPPQIVDGRTMVPIRWVAENLGADVHWDEEKRSVSVYSEDWLPRLAGSLDRAAKEFAFAPDIEGQIERVWRVDSDFLLLEYVRSMDYVYYLCDINLQEKNHIIGFIENARLEEIKGKKIVFIGKGGGDTGNYRFPYVLRYDISNDELSEEKLYLQRDVVFGAFGAWEHILKDVKLDNEELSVQVEVAEDQVLAGGHKTPFTVVSTKDNIISIRIYGIASSMMEEGLLQVDHKLIEKIEWKKLSSEEPVDNVALLKEDFPYGAGLENMEIDEPSLLVEIYCHSKPQFNIETKFEDLVLEYTVRLK